MIVRDAQTQNMILEGCGCCPLPLCEEPRIIFPDPECKIDPVYSNEDSDADPEWIAASTRIIRVKSHYDIAFARHDYDPPPPLPALGPAEESDESYTEDVTTVFEAYVNTEMEEAPVCSSFCLEHKYGYYGEGITYYYGLVTHTSGFEYDIPLTSKGPYPDPAPFEGDDFDGTAHTYDTRPVASDDTDPLSHFVYFVYYTPPEMEGWEYQGKVSDEYGDGFKFSITTSEVEDTDPDHTESFTANKYVIYYPDPHEYYQWCAPEEFLYPSNRSTYEVEWDVGAFTEVWLDWFNDGMVGAEPYPLPMHMLHGTWAWGGPLSDECSTVYTMPDPPDPVAIEGYPDPVPWVLLRMNIKVKCYKCTRTGVLPTLFGMQYEFAEEE